MVIWRIFTVLSSHNLVVARTSQDPSRVVGRPRLDIAFVYYVNGLDTWQPLGPLLKVELLVDYIASQCAVLALPILGKEDVLRLQLRNQIGKELGLHQIINQDTENKTTTSETHGAPFGST